MSIKSTTSQPNPLSQLLSPIPQGLTIMNFRHATIAVEGRNTLTHAARVGSKKIGPPMPTVKKVTSLYPGNARYIEQAKFLDAANRQVAGAVEHEIIAVGSRDAFDWCSNEGIASLQPIIEAANSGWVMFEQKVTWPFKPGFSVGLTRISNIAKQAGAWVMMFMVCPDGYEKTTLDQLCEEYIEVTECEPYPDWQLAFVFDFVNIRNLQILGYSNAMCSVKLADGVLRREFEPFVSHKLLTRAIWSLRGQQKTVEEIAKLVGLNKSNVSRSLAGLPPTRTVNIHPHWLEDYLESIQGNHHASAADPAQ